MQDHFDGQCHRPFYRPGYRIFSASRPNQLWVANLTYVAIWLGFVYVAFIIDLFVRMIVGGRASNSLRTDLALDALEQAIWAQGDIDGLVCHSDCGSQYLSMRYTERLAEAGVEPSVGSRGDSCDNALAEAVIGLYKTEPIRRQGLWRNLDAAEFAALEWVDCFDNRKLLKPIPQRNWNRRRIIKQGKTRPWWPGSNK